MDGGDGDDTVSGGDGDDTLKGGIGADVLVGDNSFSGVFGADVFTGGGGDDTFTWVLGANHHSSSAVQDLVTDFEGAGAAGGDAIDLSTGFGGPRMTFVGQLGSLPTAGDTLAGGGNFVIEVAFAFDGADTILFADDNDNGVFDATDFAVRIAGQHGLTRADFGDTPFVTVGTEAGETITGTAENETILAQGGDDVVFGEGGRDSVDGGAGNDTIEGGDGDDIAHGNAGRDHLIGNAGRDTLIGDEGADLINGGAGTDRLAGADGRDTVSGGEGNDTLDGDAGDDLLHGGAGDDDYFGGDGDDHAVGVGGNDELFGDDGNDTLEGGQGADALEGDHGADVLRGSGGGDEFIFFFGPFNPSSTLNLHDTVLDFEGAGVAGGDKLVIRSNVLVFAGEIAPGAALPGAGDGVTQLVYVNDGGTTQLIADENDNGVLDAAEFLRRVRG